MDGATVTVATLMTSAADVFGSVANMVGSTVDVITGNPLLVLVCIGLPLCGIGVGMLKRLFSARA